MPNPNSAFLPMKFRGEIQESSSETGHARAVKVAIPDLLIDDGVLSLESMTDFVFAEIGGQELLSTTRHDLIDSPLVESNVIRDAGSLFRKTKYLEPTDGITNNFAAFSVEINDYIPSSITDTLRSANLKLTDVDVFDNLYVKKDDGSIYIVFKNLKPSYKIEVSFVSIEDLVNGTIY